MMTRDEIDLRLAEWSKIDHEFAVDLLYLHR